MTRAAVAVALLLLAPVFGCRSDQAVTAPTSTAASSRSAAGPFGRPLAQNPWLGPVGTSTMHGDTGSSDTSPLPGPGAEPVSVRVVPLGAVCSTVLVGSDGLPVALCTRVADLRPVVNLLDPVTGEVLATIELIPGSLLGGVYGYLDHRDRMVLVEGTGDLVWIAHLRDHDGWSLQVDRRVPLRPSLPDGDTVSSVSPDYDDGVWFATEGGTVGLAHRNGAVETRRLGAGERVANSISTAPAGAAVATDHALYLLRRRSGGGIETAWRVAYERGPGRKPGQLSWGTGSTPTFFGPELGEDYVAIVDNADPAVHLIVVRTRGRNAGDVVCTTPVLGRGGPGSENSPIGAGRTVVVASTYGYPYPRLPDDAGPSVPPTSPFVGGMTRVDVRADGSGCDVVWDTTTRSVAVPKLSTSDGMITTVLADTGPDGKESYLYAVVDFENGMVLAQQALGSGVGDPLQMAGTLGPGRVLWQGTLGSLARIAPDRQSSPR